MAAVRFDITIEQGSDYSQPLEFSEDDGTLTDLTGYSYQGQIRRTYSDPDVIGEFSFEVPTPTNGEVFMKMAKEVTRKLPVPRAKSADKTTVQYAYDVEQTDADGKVTRILEGIVTVSPEVTR